MYNKLIVYTFDSHLTNIHLYDNNLTKTFKLYVKLTKPYKLLPYKILYIYMWVSTRRQVYIPIYDIDQTKNQSL